MNLGLKFRDSFFGKLGHIVREELDQMVASISEHFLVEHNIDGTHGTLTADQVTVDDLVIANTGPGFLTQSAAGATVVAREIAPTDFGGTPDGTKFLRDDGTWAAPPGASGGEANTASNVGTAGEGFYDGKVGVDLQFRKLNPGSAKLVVTLDGGNQKIDIDLGTVNLDHLADVIITAAGSGKLLRHNGTNWVDDVLVADDLPSHNHAAGDINSGTMATARLGSGTADGTTFLRGDQTWAVPAGGSATHDFMFPVGIGSTAASGALTDATCYAVCVGRLPTSATAVRVRFEVTAAMAGVVTYAEVGIGKGTPPGDGTSPSITPVGHTDVSAVINSTGTKTVDVSVAGGQTLNSGDYLWLLIAQSASSTNPTLRTLQPEASQSGFHGTRTTTQISTNIGSALTFTLATGATNASPWMSAKPS
jgi:hypothetical protein